MNKYDVLKKYFNYDFFKNKQEEIIDSILAKNDTLAILATGGGKSICYQIPALMFDGITIVISPLISLMEDQVRELKIAGVNAEFINSELEYFKLKTIVDNLKKSLIKLLYISPEKFTNSTFNKLFLNLNISLIVIDEAHCVSIWGNDFRLSYKEIKNVISCFKKRPIMAAFTATANKKVKEDIIEMLNLNVPNIFTSGFDRPNLFYGVVQTNKKRDYLLKFLLSHKDEVGIIYTLTR